MCLGALVRSVRHAEGRNNSTNGPLRCYRYAGFFCAALSTLIPASGQAEEKSTTLPPVHVDAPQNRPASKPQQAATTRTSASKKRAARSNQPPKPVAQAADD